MIKFFIDPDSKDVLPEITYLLETWAKNQQVQISIVSSSAGAVKIGRKDTNELQLSDQLVSREKQSFESECLFRNGNGKPDYIRTAFYMINSLQEYVDNDRDELNRFKFTNSYQFRFKNSKENVAQNCFSEISKIVGLAPRAEKSYFFLSHDMDMVNGAILEDGFNVIKKGRVDLFLRMLFNVAIGKPDWLNIDKIMKIESEYDCKSIFFWIVNKGKINNREKNADYSFQSRKIQKLLKIVEQNGFENGIHKSMSPETFTQEFVKFKRQPFSNRYHYLKFNLPQAYHDIDEAGLKLDASLGFAEEIGFRNSYGLPFNPYSFKSRKPFSFLEVPLHIMDRTYFQYKKYPVIEVQKDILDFFEKNKNNSIISILWHNNFFTNYKFKGYLDLYKKILAYIRENNFGTISQGEIVKKYSIA